MDTTMQGNGKGALFGVIVIILLLVAGGLYLGFKNTAQQELITPQDTATTTTDTSIGNTSLDQTSAAIEADLNNPDLQTIDEDVADINAAIAQ